MVIISLLIYIVFEMILCGGSAIELHKIKKRINKKIFEMIFITQLQILSADIK